MSEPGEALRGLRTPPRAPRPRLRDYHVDGPRLQALASALRAHSLFMKTRRITNKQGIGPAGRNLVKVPSNKLTGVDVDCDRLGLRWRLNPADVAQRTMFALGSFDDTLVVWMQSQLRAGDHLVDIGAHVGLFATQFAHTMKTLGDGRVTAFEPAPDSAKRLRNHMAINALADRVTVVEAAIGAAAGVIELRSVEPSSSDDPSLRSLHGKGAVVAANIKLLRFDDWWAEAGKPAIDVVKIDVEGGEFDVVSGMLETLKATKPRLLVVEIKKHLSANAGVDPERVVAQLTNLGYQNLGPFSVVVGLGPIPHLDDNIVFVRGDAS